jgi:hypothetical protein
MAMATSGTSDYIFVVPEAPRRGTRQMQGALRQPLQLPQALAVNRLEPPRM